MQASSAFGLEVLSLIQEPETASRSKQPHVSSRQGLPDHVRPAFPGHSHGNVLEKLQPEIGAGTKEASSEPSFLPLLASLGEERRVST